MEVFAQFQSESGEIAGPQLTVPTQMTSKQLQGVLNELLSSEETIPYLFFINGVEVTTTVEEVLRAQTFSTESVVPIVYQPQATFRVRAVTRCTGTIPGHTEAVLCVAFSPDGEALVSGGGDATVRFWDMLTETPIHTCKGHKNWVLCVAWSPDGKKVVSGGMDKEMHTWNADSGTEVGRGFVGHSKPVTSLAWEPIHLNGSCSRFVSGSKDGTLRVWNAGTSHCEMVLSGHANCVTSVRWCGDGLICSASRDRTIKVWESATGKLCRSLEEHGHWVNSLALSTDWVLRNAPPNAAEAQKTPKQRYDDVVKGKPERMVSASDDHTLYLWEPSTSKKPIARMTGHQQPVNHVCFSPDGRYIASASFDRNIKLWEASSGKFIASLHGHVGAVYQIAWSSDSRLLVSASKDSTLKVWDIQSRKLKFDLPGHSDEVFAVDWSASGERVASGGKDCVLKIWRD